MEDDSKLGRCLVWGLGAVGLGAVAAAVTMRGVWIWIALGILLLALLLFGGLYWWQQRKSRRKKAGFGDAVSEGTGKMPGKVSDPNKRAALEKLRTTFDEGVQEFEKFGKSVYSIPWYLVIGSSGAGKTEAIRSGLKDECLPKFQDYVPGPGGTINMNWWFTKKAIILDTAGALLFPEQKTSGESEEFKEFLRLLKKTRASRPINGLFIVLGYEPNFVVEDPKGSGIRRLVSAQEISDTAGEIQRKLDVIQSELDVRFPVYVIVSKCDLLTGFREFTEGIKDPNDLDLPYQMFGWSNPHLNLDPEDPDTKFHPEQVEQYLHDMAEHVRRRRMALLPAPLQASAQVVGGTQFFGAGGIQLGRAPASVRHLDEVDSLFALPEGLERLASRLRRYLEIIFVSDADSWEAGKPLFFRGIYFTSSLCEGKATDDALALARQGKDLDDALKLGGGVAIDQVQDQHSWERNRAFFLRHLFLEKAFRESGLVTRATNALKHLRKLRWTIFGTAAGLLAVLLTLVIVTGLKLKKSVGAERDLWKAGATNLSPIVTPEKMADLHYAYMGTNRVEGTDLNLVEFHNRIKELASRKLSGSGAFSLVATDARPKAQVALFERSVIAPLIDETRNKMIKAPAPKDSSALDRHRAALWQLIQLEVDRLANSSGEKGAAILSTDPQKPAKFLGDLLAYLTDDSTNRGDPKLVSVFVRTYSSGANPWPPPSLVSNCASLKCNPAISAGLENFRNASRVTQEKILKKVQSLNALADALSNYSQAESRWFPADNCAQLEDLRTAKQKVDKETSGLTALLEATDPPFTNLASLYTNLEGQASDASTRAFDDIKAGVPAAYRTKGIIFDIFNLLKQFAGEAGDVVHGNYTQHLAQLVTLDSLYLPPWKNGEPVYRARWKLYEDACNLASKQIHATESDLGSNWAAFTSLESASKSFRTNLDSYLQQKDPPYSVAVSNNSEHIAGEAERQFRDAYVNSYVATVKTKVASIAAGISNFESVTNAIPWFNKIEADLRSGEKSGVSRAKLEEVRSAVMTAKGSAVESYAQSAGRTLNLARRFPIILDSDPGAALSREGLLGIKTKLQTLDTELTNSAWDSLPNSEKLLTPLRGNSLARVARAMVMDDKSLAVVELYVVPPAKSTPDWDALRIYTKANISFGPGNSAGPSEIARDVFEAARPVGVGTNSLDSGLTISFLKDFNSPTNTLFSCGDWALPRLIRAGNATKFDGTTTKWRFKLPLKDQEIEGGSGFVTFEAHISQALPERQDWGTTK
jgi:hypothetical protein